ncbi:DUF4446 family protein [Alicyclobacillus ferrooxydans]|uniref:DUF4446 domain-containing protein n=1 Tax=Alicyclobacillus ferrooxydans TaxID=471514 RepID=A0A0N8PNU5_9BACL|nr:DUF4446 family protein [Alicyclobacillus ferrooxydans]KPV42501.1 hypothetical protein AN477_17260 [Alicyclobacillus ferrooxydans]
MKLSSETMILWLIVLSAIAILNFVLFLVSSAQKSKMRRQFKRWQGIHQTADLEAVYAQTIDKVREAEESLANVAANVRAMETALRTKIGTPSIKRYNAFSDTGSDLSFSIALLDDTQTGVVLSSIYGREESRTYGKPVVEGQSTYPLTSEESEVVSLSKHKVPKQLV